MGSKADRPFSALTARLGYEFADESLLQRALTHASFGGPQAAAVRDNERLEFLGDRVLGLIAAEMVFTAFPKSSEGDLALMYNALVRKETCAEVAGEIDLGTHLRLGPGEARAGGRRKTAILGNACEALIAALYLDGGMEAARAFVERHWHPRLAAVSHAPRDPKTVLQEWAQARGLPPPSYRVLERSGPDHAPRFEIAVEVEEHAPEKGIGKSKQRAEQAAAEAFLKVHGIAANDDG